MENLGSFEVNIQKDTLVFLSSLEVVHRQRIQSWIELATVFSGQLLSVPELYFLVHHGIMIR